MALKYIFYYFLIIFNQKNSFKNILCFITIILGLFQNVMCQNVVINLKLDNTLIARNGLGWPSVINVAKGNEVLMKLRENLENQNTCTVTDPLGLKFDVSAPPNIKYQKWGDGCGVRVRNITLNDEGRWRLTATNSKNSITGWIAVHVLEEMTSYTAPPISLKDGETQTRVDLSTLDNSYCVVAKPFSESSLVPGTCRVTLDRTTRAVQGDWQVYLGLPGSVTELQTNRHITVQTEHLDVGYVRDSANKLHLYCNILHTTKNITFCRFQKTSNSYGYNVIDGLSDGSHSYYGRGFALNECGMTIEKPTSQDHGTWRCSVGVQIVVGNQIQPQTPMQALISIAPSFSSALAREKKSVDDTRTIFVQENSPFTIMCNSKVSLTYCWFQHPNGTQFTPVRLLRPTQQFWYTGESLEVGDCGITFAHASSEDDGKWSCYMGPRNTLGIEMSDAVQVRVTGPLAANQKEVPAHIGGNATLYCHTSNNRRPLNYCRFLSPKFVGMSIDSSIMPENAILNRFYFTPEKKLNAGDCSLSILSVKEEDFGEWTCAAVVDNEVSESRDTIRLFINNEQRSTQFQAGIIGMAVGLCILVMALIGYIAYKRNWISFFVHKNNPSRAENHSLQTIGSINSDSGSISSGSSGELTVHRS